MLVLNIVLAILIAGAIFIGCIGAYAFWDIFYPETGSKFAQFAANTATVIMFLLFLVFALAPLFGQ